MKKALGIIAIVILALLVILGVYIYIDLPDVLRKYLEFHDFNEENIYNALLKFMYAAGVPSLIMLVLSIMLNVNILRNRSFVKQNVVILKCISLVSIVIAVCCICVAPAVTSFFPPIIAVCFIVLALMIYIVGDLFKIAIKYKEENDLTI